MMVQVQMVRETPASDARGDEGVFTTLVSGDLYINTDKVASVRTFKGTVATFERNWRNERIAEIYMDNGTSFFVWFTAELNVTLLGKPLWKVEQENEPEGAEAK